MTRCPVIHDGDDILLLMYYGDLPIKYIEKRFDICDSAVYGRLRANYVFVTRTKRNGWSKIDDAKILYTRYNGGTGQDFEDCVPGRKRSAVKDRMKILIHGGHGAY